ncbi:MAG: FprA family A-type flavoprotein [Lachnospiraceae bacterium]|nr:FprA family A-type flavoprotein [Lachnospiraceae bacterium]
MYISESIKYIGVNDTKIDLFESQYPVPDGMTYNSYVILDEKIAVMDTVEADFVEQWHENMGVVLNGRTPDYLVIQHMEPDHSANIRYFMSSYPEAKIVASEKAFTMIKNFFGTDYADRRIVVADGDTLSLGQHTLTFYTAPMVHWPEVIVTYDSFDKVLFSADGFGCFGYPNNIREWIPRGRRYYMGIVAKYGPQVQSLLKKLSGLDIQKICSLHGAVIDKSLDTCLKLYNTWSSYEPEEEGVVIAYTSIYGNTKKAVDLLVEKLRVQGENNIVVYDLSRCDISLAVTDAFRYSTLILATPTYNGDVFPFMKSFIEHLTERNFQKRKVAFIENGSWAPTAAKVMASMLEKSKNLTYADTTVTIMSALKKENILQIEDLAKEMGLSPQL